MPRSLSLLIALSALGGCERQFVNPCPPLVAPTGEVALTAPPFLQVRRSHVRLRFESLEFVEIPVSVEVAGERCTTVLTPELDRESREWTFPIDGTDVPLPDVAGEHALHTARLEFEDLAASGEVSWTVHSGPDEASWYSGTARLPPTAEQGASVLVVGSMAPTVQATALGLGGPADLVILNGDLRRSGTPESTWSQLAHDLSATQPSALVHTALGELEDIDPTSRDEVYLRWFGGQGRPGSDERYHALDVAGVRFLVLDGEDPRLGNEAAQWRWIVSELEDVQASETLREAVVVLHKGPHGLTEQVPFAELREDFLPMLQSFGVRLLLSGHGHAYQRFDADGLVVVDDGGGGAELGDLDHRLERDPDGAAARLVASATHGVTRLEILPGGEIELTRLDVQGGTVDTVSLPAP